MSNLQYRLDLQRLQRLGMVEAIWGETKSAEQIAAIVAGFHAASELALATRVEPAKARWLQDFLGSYPAQLAAAGLWSPADQEALDTEISHAMAHPSIWVTPALIEMVWEKP